MPWTRDEVARRAAQEIADGFCVNLGVGIPTLVANHLPAGLRVMVHSENGLIGTGPYPAEHEIDPDVINAGKETVTIVRGGAMVDSVESFALIRGGHIDLTILGGMEVSAAGDLANWGIPGKLVKGIGGAMDLVNGAKRVLVVMEHVSRDGRPKIVDRCSLPLTGARVVHRVITDRAVLDVTPDGLVLREIAPGGSVDDVQACTQPKLIVSSKVRIHV